jgi:hypothetical protein
MGTDAEPHVQLEIGHVLFIDVVGYSKLLLDEQRELQQQTQVVRAISISSHIRSSLTD